MIFDHRIFVDAFAGCITFAFSTDFNNAAFLQKLERHINLSERFVERLRKLLGRMELGVFEGVGDGFVNRLGAMVGVEATVGKSHLPTNGSVFKDGIHDGSGDSHELESSLPVLWGSQTVPLGAVQFRR